MKRNLRAAAFAAACLLAVCLLGGCAATPAESIGKPPAESDSVLQTENAASLPQEPAVETDSASVVESSSAELSEEEKIEKRFETGARFSVGEDEAVWLGSTAYTRKDANSPAHLYRGEKTPLEEGLDLWHFYGDSEGIGRTKSAFVLVMQNGAPADAFYYDCVDHYKADWRDMDGEEPPEGLIRSYAQWDAAAQTLTQFWERSDLELVTDLAAREVRGQYKIQFGNLEDVLVQSPCGRYDICTAGRTAGGDSSSSSIVLRDNETGTLQWLSRRRSHYSDYGFFANGDLYVREPDCLRMFSKESGYTEQYPFEMPFGSQPEGFTRYLCAVRRDPADSTYLVVYFEQTEQQAQDRWEKPFETDVRFILGKCDENGRLLQSWNSGQIVVSPLYDTSWVDLWVQDGDVYVNAYQKSDQTPVVAFSFDPESETFTAHVTP